MKDTGKQKNRITLLIEIALTIAICFGIVYTSFSGLSAESRNYATEVMADYNTLTKDYIRSFKILRMEAVNKINEDPSFDEMLDWLQSREGEFRDAIGEGVYDGFAFTYKGDYAHSWDYGDYSQYDPNTRPWYQMAQAADGEIAVVAPYTTFLSNTDYVERYDNLRMSIAQKYNDEISFDFDLDVKEINALITERRTIYNETIAFLYDSKGYILSSTDPDYYGHNINTVDKKVSKKLAETMKNHESESGGMKLRNVDGTIRLIYSVTNDDGLTLCLLLPFTEVFQRNILFVMLLALVLIAIEVMFYHRNEVHLDALEKNKIILKDALRNAESANHAKGDFMSRMSHEIRTPLNAIIGYLEIAKDEHENTEKIGYCIDKSQVASKHLLSIINDVLDISSIESGRMKLAHDDFDIKQMVNALTTLFYSQARAKGVDFAVHIDFLENEWLAGDELRVRQILLNLLSNAVKFTPKDGTIKLNIRQVSQTDSISDGKTRIEFKVSDTGIGMSREYMDRMFQPFEQESASTARNYGGTGLGLSITNNLANMMGGQIKVESQQGEGTTFTVLLPFDAAEKQHQESPSTDSFANIKALVVDDEKGTCEYVRKLLSRLGVKCDTVNSGKKALRRVMSRLDSEHPYDLCIIDWNMPEMDGLETAREVRRLCGKDIPIIIATAYDYASIVDEAKAAGVDKIVSKPLFQSTLLNLLVNTYGKYEPRESKVSHEVDFKGMKLILAEDNEMNMEIALDILRKVGLVITPVVNGQEALETFEKSQPGTFDAILMDIQMPVMDGYTATRKIRKSSHPQAKTIPIVAMTANAFSEDVTASLAAGMNDHVAKPVSYDRLFQVLNRLAGGAQD